MDHYFQYTYHYGKHCFATPAGRPDVTEETLKKALVTFANMPRNDNEHFSWTIQDDGHGIEMDLVVDYNTYDQSHSLLERLERSFTQRLSRSLMRSLHVSEAPKPDLIPRSGIDISWFETLRIKNNGR